jgi:hypothetical protein
VHQRGLEFPPCEILDYSVDHAVIHFFIASSKIVRINSDSDTRCPAAIFFNVFNSLVGIRSPIFALCRIMNSTSTIHFTRGFTFVKRYFRTVVELQAARIKWHKYPALEAVNAGVADIFISVIYPTGTQ